METRLVIPRALIAATVLLVTSAASAQMPPPDPAKRESLASDEWEKISYPRQYCAESGMKYGCDVVAKWLLVWRGTAHSSEADSLVIAGKKMWDDAVAKRAAAKTPPKRDGRTVCADLSIGPAGRPKGECDKHGGEVGYTEAVTP